MAVLGELLFYSGSQRAALSDVLHHNETKTVGSAVEKLAQRMFDTKSDDELVSVIVKECTVNPLVLKLAESKGGARETTVDVNNNWGERATVKGLSITKEIPFDGDGLLFQLQPSTYGLNPPRGDVRGQKLIIGMEVHESQSEEAIRYIEQTVASVQICIDRQADAIQQSNASLSGAAYAAIQQRRTSLGKASDIAKRLGGG